MWPRIALFKAAKELWRLKNSPDLEKVCIPRSQRLNPALYTHLEGKNVHTPRREPLSPCSSYVSGQLQEVSWREVFHAHLAGVCTRF